MKSRFVYIILLALIGLTGYAQTPTHDQLVQMERDTANSQLAIGVIGDVFSGYRTLCELTNLNTTPPHEKSFRWYHVDWMGNKVRQIVMLKSKWNNTPQDILSDDGGYRLAALTPKEYVEMKYRGEIYGDIWEFSLPDNPGEDKNVTDVGCELVCYSDSIDFSKMKPLCSEIYRYSREVMVYTDTTNGRQYMCGAKNKHWGADYLPSKTDGKYDSRLITLDKDEERRWWQKWYKWQESLKIMQRNLKSI